MARREFQADFEDGTVIGTSFTRRPDAIVGSLYALSFGPRAVSDPSEGLLVKGWYVRVENGNDLGTVYLGEPKPVIADGWEPEIPLFTFVGGDGSIDFIDFTFDQNGAPVVVCERSGEVWLRWYRPGVGTVFEMLGYGVDPRIILDDPINEDTSEILVFYERAGQIRYRVQSELYAIEQDTGYVLAPNEYLQGTLRDKQHRVHLILAIRDVTAGTWTTDRLTSKLYPIPVGPDSATVAGRAVAGAIKLVILTPETTLESLDIGHRVVDAELIPAVWPEALVDAFDLAVQVDAVDVVPLVQQYAAVDEAEISNRSVAGTVDVVILLYAATAEEVDLSNRAVSGTIVTP